MPAGAWTPAAIADGNGAARRTCRHRQGQQAAKRLSQQVNGARGGALRHLLPQEIHHNRHQLRKCRAVLQAGGSSEGNEGEMLAAAGAMHTP